MNNYSGNQKPFAFVLYHPSEEAKALPVIERLAEKRTLYAASALGKKEESILDKASAAVLILSPDSQNAMEEATAKLVRSGKPFVPVFLAPTTLTPGMRLLLGTTQGVRFGTGPDDAAWDALLSSPVWDEMTITPGQKRAARRLTLGVSLGAAAVVIAVIVSVLLSGTSQKIAPDSTLGQLGLSGSVTSIKSVYLYGDELEDRYEEAGVFEALDGINSPEKGLIYLPGADRRVSWGTLSDLTDFAQLTNLEELSLAGNEIVDLSPLYGLSKLRRLDVSLQHHDDELMTLRGIGALTGLEELNLAFTDLDESCAGEETVAELRGLPAMKRLVLSSEGSFLGDALGDVPYEIVYLDTRVSDLAELKAAADAPGVYTITLTAPLVIPEGEEIVIGKNQRLTGVMLDSFENRGTLRLYGTLAMGMVNLRNYGTILVEDGGLLGGGMSDHDNYGTVIIRSGGRHQLERGLLFRQQDGLYRNEGTLQVNIGGQFNWNGGTVENDGRIEIATDLALPEKEFREQEGLPTDWHALRFVGQTENITGSGEIVLLGDGSVY